MFKLLSFLLFIVIVNCDQCIRYEFHETAIRPEGNAELIANDCRSKNAKVTDYNVVLLSLYGPFMINTTFNCCSSLPCKNDLQCPFNFNCNRGKCLVADCNLRDEIEIVEEENNECMIDEDCFFRIPLDKKHWMCINEKSECIHKENCIKRCKRCPFIGDHWSNLSNNSIDINLYSGAGNNPLNENLHFLNDFTSDLLNNTNITNTLTNVNEARNEFTEHRNDLNSNSITLNEDENRYLILENRNDERPIRPIRNFYNNNSPFNTSSISFLRREDNDVGNRRTSITLNLTTPRSITTRSTETNSIEVASTEISLTSINSTLASPTSVNLVSLSSTTIDSESVSLLNNSTTSSSITNNLPITSSTEASSSSPSYEATISAISSLITPSLPLNNSTVISSRELIANDLFSPTASFLNNTVEFDNVTLSSFGNSLDFNLDKLLFNNTTSLSSAGLIEHDLSLNSINNSTINSSMSLIGNSTENLTLASINEANLILPTLRSLELPNLNFSNNVTTNNKTLTTNLNDTSFTEVFNNNSINNNNNNNNNTINISNGNLTIPAEISTEFIVPITNKPFSNSLSNSTLVTSSTVPLLFALNTSTSSSNTAVSTTLKPLLITRSPITRSFSPSASNFVFNLLSSNPSNAANNSLNVNSLNLNNNNNNLINLINNNNNNNLNSNHNLNNNINNHNNNNNNNNNNNINNNNINNYHHRDNNRFFTSSIRANNNARLVARRSNSRRLNSNNSNRNIINHSRNTRRHGVRNNSWLVPSNRRVSSATTPRPVYHHPSISSNLINIFRNNEIINPSMIPSIMYAYEHDIPRIN